MDNRLIRSKLIKERLFECLKNGELTYTNEIEIVQYIAQRLNLTTKSQLAKERGISFNGMKSRIKSGKEMIIELNGTELICN